MTIEVGISSEQGKYRDRNTDVISTWNKATYDKQGGRLFVLTDGAGRGDYGNLASKMVVTLIGKGYYRLLKRNPTLSPAEALSRVLKQVNQKVYERADTFLAQGDMGAAFIAAVVQETSVTIAWYGNCRAYFLPKEKKNVQQLSIDHTIRKDNHQTILPLVGVSPQIQTGIRTLDVEPGDSLILCSDGLYKYFSLDDYVEIVRYRMSMQMAAVDLVSAAIERDTPDNASVIVIQWQDEVPIYDQDNPAWVTSTQEIRSLLEDLNLDIVSNETETADLADSEFVEAAEGVNDEYEAISPFVDAPAHDETQVPPWLREYLIESDLPVESKLEIDQSRSPVEIEYFSNELLSDNPFETGELTDDASSSPYPPEKQLDPTVLERGIRRLEATSQQNTLELEKESPLESETGVHALESVTQQEGSVQFDGAEVSLDDGEIFTAPDFAPTPQPETGTHAIDSVTQQQETSTFKDREVSFDDEEIFASPDFTPSALDVIETTIVDEEPVPITDYQLPDTQGVSEFIPEPQAHGYWRTNLIVIGFSGVLLLIALTIMGVSFLFSGDDGNTTQMELNTASGVLVKATVTPFDMVVTATSLPATNSPATPTVIPTTPPTVDVPNGWVNGTELYVTKRTGLRANVFNPPEETTLKRGDVVTVTLARQTVGYREWYEYDGERWWFVDNLGWLAESELSERPVR